MLTPNGQSELETDPAIYKIDSQLQLLSASDGLVI